MVGYYSQSLLYVPYETFIFSIRVKLNHLYIRLKRARLGVEVPVAPEPRAQLLRVDARRRPARLLCDLRL